VVVEVVVVVVPGNVVVVVVEVVEVEVLVVVVVVEDRAISGVTTMSVEINRPLTPTERRVPRRNSQRGDNFTHLPYFARNDLLVTPS
jgi:hypothetical protein